MTTNPCFWPHCRRQAMLTIPVCLEHATVIHRQVHNSVGNPGRQQVAGTIGEPVVYYIETKPNVIKIGTTADLKARLRSLRVDMEDVRALEPGGFPKEHHRHREFAHLRRGKREDFNLTDELRAHIDTILSVFGTPADVLDAIRRRNREQLAENRTKR